jgi:wyosine [tRNA(Phe)-imidazoG37] synthetase (radical SAM superfamily)
MAETMLIIPHGAQGHLASYDCVYCQVERLERELASERVNVVALREEKAKLAERLRYFVGEQKA